jgi:ABC-type transport system involved in multi-copper enzyme maturation permease subunit
MLGPHFYYDLIRLARRGWPTWLRVLYLVVLLLSLTIMYQTDEKDVAYQRLAQQAVRGHHYAMTIIVMQDLFIVLLLPVYVAGAVVEDKETRVIESLFLTHLTDREMTFGKLAARLLPLMAIVAAGFPLLMFLMLYGNIPIAMLLYHEANSLLLLLSGGSICIWFSTRSESVFQAINNAYAPVLFGLGLFGIVGAFVAPWAVGMVVAIAVRMTGVRGGPLEPWYGVALAVLVMAHASWSISLLLAAVANLQRYRLEKRKSPRRLTSALALTDNRRPDPLQRKHRARSRIHPLARTVRGNALFWKECLKDGTGWSLSARWLLGAMAIVIMASIGFRMLLLPVEYLGPGNRSFLLSLAAPFPYTAYFTAVLAYTLTVVFQTTMSVAGEKEGDTLDFLLIIPEERPRILYYKWLGPLWRNWPVLAIGYLGILLGWGLGVYSWTTAVTLALLPCPLLLMLSTLALWLSVLCRRVLHANIILIVFLAVLLIAHVAAWAWLGNAVLFYVMLLFETSLEEFTHIPRAQAIYLALGEQTLFLMVAAACTWQALRRFRLA